MTTHNGTGCNTLDLTALTRGSPILDLQERGRIRALESGVVEPQERDLDQLSEYARSAATYVARPGFDPAGSLQDGMREALYQKNLSELKRDEEMLRIATAQSREASEAAARKRAAVGQRADLPLVAMIAAICVLAISVAPTLHDFIFHTLPDDILNWFLSLGVSALLGVMLAWGLFSSSAARSRAPMAVGIVISVGLGILRLSAAETLREVVFTIGLTLMEIGVVLFLDWRAGIYNTAIDSWTARTTAAAEAEAFSTVQGQEVARLAGEQQRLTGLITDHLDYLARREELMLDATAREQVYIQAVRDSYLQVVAENRGRLQKSQ